MSAPGPSEAPRKKRRWLLISLVAAGTVIMTLLAAVFVPVHSESHTIQVTSESGASASLSLPSDAWVTVHFDHAGAMPMVYWMNQPGGGMMFNHGGMMSGDSYSFWSSGGSYRCWAGYGGAALGMTPVWVNATWGLI